MMLQAPVSCDLGEFTTTSTFASDDGGPGRLSGMRDQGKDRTL